MSYRVGKEAPINGLVLELFVGEPKFAHNLAVQSGLSVFVTNHTVLPSLQEGLDIETGKETNIILGKNE